MNVTIKPQSPEIRVGLDSVKPKKLNVATIKPAKNRKIIISKKSMKKKK